MLAGIGKTFEDMANENRTKGRNSIRRFGIFSRVLFRCFAQLEGQGR